MNPSRSLPSFVLTSLTYLSTAPPIRPYVDEARRRCLPPAGISPADGFLYCTGKYCTVVALRIDHAGTHAIKDKTKESRRNFSRAAPLQKRDPEYGITMLRKSVPPPFSAAPDCPSLALCRDRMFWYGVFYRGTASHSQSHARE
jgi:hypothetical protein